MLRFWVRFVAAVVGSLSRVTCHHKLHGAYRLAYPCQTIGALSLLHKS